MDHNAPTPHPVFTKRIHSLVVGAVAIAAHLNTLPNDYCYDDVAIVRDSALVNAPGKSLDIWTSDYWSESGVNGSQRDLLYRPTTVASLRAVRGVFGPSPLPQHAVNVLLHAVVSMLVLQLALTLGLPTRVALASGVLFAVLPIHVEAVAAIVGRADLLASAGALAALLLSAKSGALARTASAVAVFVAMSSKESGVAVVPILLLWEQIAGKALRIESRSPHPPLTRGDKGGFLFSASTLRTVAILALPLAIYLALRYSTLGAFFQQPAPSKTINALVDAPTWQRVLGAFQLVGMYVQKTIWPDVLCISYAINAVRPAGTLLDAHVLLGLFALGIGIVSSAVSWHRGNRSIAFLFVATLLAYVPTANAFVLIQVFFAERIWYLPSVFLCIALGAVCARLPAYRLSRTIGFLLLLGMMLRGWARNSEWRDNGTLFASCYRDHPESISCLNLYGKWLADHGDTENGIKLLTRAIEMDLGFTDAQRALGQAYLAADDLERAVLHLQTADMQVPHDPPTVEALASACLRLDEQQGGRIETLRQAANASPTDLDAELSYVRALSDVGQRKEALARFAERERDFEGAIAWQHQHAVTLVLLDQRDPAIDRYRRALQLAHPLSPPLPRGAERDRGGSGTFPRQGALNSDPETTRIMVELAMLLLERRSPGDLESAGGLCENAVKAAPNDPSAYVCRAEHSALRGDIPTALAAYQQAIALLPTEHPQRRIFEQRAKTLGR